MIKVLIADDQKTVQEILKSYIEPDPGLELVGCAGDGKEALDLVENYQPDVVLMDIEMPIMDGLEATQIISEKFITTNVLIISVHNEDTYLDTALQVGAKGYLKKNTPEKELINAIYSSYKGYFQLGPGLLEQYLFKATKSNSNSQEIDQLKSVILEQSKLLDSINGNRSRKDRTNQFAEGEQFKINQAMENRCASLERQLFNVSSRLEQLTKRFNLLQQLCALVILSGGLLGLAIIFSTLT